MKFITGRGPIVLTSNLKASPLARFRGTVSTNVVTVLEPRFPKLWVCAITPLFRAGTCLLRVRFQVTCVRSSPGAEHVRPQCGRGVCGRAQAGWTKNRPVVCADGDGAGTR